MLMKRGFKADAEKLALELRSELLLKDNDPIDTFLLAEHLCIPVIHLSSLRAEMSPKSIQILYEDEVSAFSGITIHEGARRLVVLNDAHADVRQRSSLAHELSHALLGHPPSPLTNGQGERHYDAEIEDEAKWLSGALLIPRPAAMHIAFRGISQHEAAKSFMVSIPMLKYRLRVTGALAAASRYVAKRS